MVNLFTRKKTELKQSWMRTFPVQAFIFLFLVGAFLLQLGIYLWNFFLSKYRVVPNILGPFIIITIVVLGIVYIASIIFKVVPLATPRDYFIFLVVITSIILAFVYLERLVPYIFSVKNTPLQSVIQMMNP
jgi:hypothetical protein